MDMAQTSDVVLKSRLQALGAQIRRSQSETQTLDEEASEIREELRRRGMSKGLRDALALIPLVVSSQFHQDFARMFIEHVAGALGPEANVRAILDRAHLPESESLVWIQSLSGDSQDKTWLMETLTSRLNDPLLERHRQGFRRMAELL